MVKEVVVMWSFFYFWMQRNIKGNDIYTRNM